MSMNQRFEMIRVFRFVNDINGPKSPDFRSPKSLVKPRDYRKMLENGLTVVEELHHIKLLSRQQMANMTAAGELRFTSHMIPVFEDPDKALSSTSTVDGDPSLRSIIWESEYLASFEVPKRLIYRPHTYDRESELMVLCNCIWKYLLLIRKNPYKLSKQSMMD
jgi:hypothetical protein